MAERGRQVVVVGAGVAGLTVALRLAERGDAVTVVEREDAVGGLSRSYRYGDFCFDVGPHRFHTYDPVVEAFIREVLRGELVEVGRSSAVWLFGRYLEWPLTPRVLAAIPVPVLLRVGLDLWRRPPPASERFSDYIVARYGETLYRQFFQPYTERFVRVPADALSRDWAETSIERALIDRGLRANSLVELARSALWPRPPLRLLYPAKGGFGAFAEALAARVTAAGGRVLTARPVSALSQRGAAVAAVRAGDEELPCELLVWTGALPALLALLGEEPPELPFLSALLFNCEVSAPARLPYQWCYYSDAAVPFSRVSTPSRLNPAQAPPGKTGLCVEVTALPTDAAWAEPTALEPAIREGLVRVGQVGRAADLGAIHVERVPQAWPVYTLGYRERLQAARALAARHPNVRLLGRNATFWYNNADHSVGAALQLAARLDKAG